MEKEAKFLAIGRKMLLLVFMTLNPDNRVNP